MQKMQCPACGNKDNLRFIEKWLNYKLILCNFCGLSFSEPMKSCSSIFYEEPYEAGQSYGWRWEFEEFLKDPHIKKGRLLDVGCGDGLFLNMARDAGYSVAGVDFNRSALQMAKKKYNLNNLFAEDIYDHLLNNPNTKYDVITCFHIIEHLEDPAKFLLMLRCLLAVDGFLIIGIPNQLRWQLKYKRESFDYPPNHLTRWSKKSMRVFLKMHKFEILKIKDKQFVLNNYRDVLHHIRSILTIKLSFGKVIKINATISDNPAHCNRVTRLTLAVYRRISKLRNFFVELTAHVIAAICISKFRGITLMDEELYIVARLKE